MSAFFTIGSFTFNIFAIVISVVVICLLLAFYNAHRANKINWVDLVSRDGTTLSLSKVLQLAGAVISSWIMIKLTLQDSLTAELLIVYLTYVASVDGFAKWISYRSGRDTKVIDERKAEE